MRTFLLEIFDYFNTYFPSIDWQRSMLTFKVIALVFSVLFLTAIIYLIIRIRKNTKESLVKVAERTAAPGLSQKMVSDQWQSILDKLEKEEADSYKLAVMEADKILDDLLKKKGYLGEDMGERLKQIGPNQLSNLDEVWQAHKLRNRIAHEPDFQINRSQAKRAVEIYQRALEDLETL